MASRVCIVGCGSLGSVYAAQLARAGSVEVFVYDASREHVQAIRERGLRISGAADMVVKVPATTQAAEIPLCDVGIFATKAVHTAAAMEQTSHIFADSSLVCSIQNGLGNEEIIGRHVKQVARGVTSMAAHTVEPGHSELELYGDLWIGPFEPSGTSYSSVEDLAALFAEAELPCTPLRDARGAQWTKLIFNSAVNPVAALTRLHHGAAVRFEPTDQLCEALLREGEAVAQALDIILHTDPRAILAEGASARVKRKPSMLLDVLAGRQTEVDFVNGAIADLGEELGLPVPLNRAVWQLMKGLEHSWANPS